ncbi:MAG: sulfotransferase domain-containing protein [Rubrobacteraceae bacterium]
MPFFKHFTSIDLMRDLRAFLKLEAGVVRGEIPRTSQPDADKRARDGSAPGGVKPENIVWIFASGRSGTTWLRDMMKDVKGYRAWEEPWVGALFGRFHNNSGSNQLKAANFILGEPYRQTWLRCIRNFVLEGAEARFPKMNSNDYLVIKEPNGSEGAPLLMEALPESRMVFLVRDPRDVAASLLDGAREGHWLYERNQTADWKRNSKADKQPDEFIKAPANEYVRKVGKAGEAYEAHKGPKVLVKYEDLNAETLDTMKRIYSTLELPASAKEIERVVEKHSWENIPENKRGEGKFYRKAIPGGWREDLTPRQVEIVEEITAPLLKKFYGG